MSATAELLAAHRERLRASRHRAQHGYTLLEVLLVVAISGLIIGPLFAWMLLTMRQQPVQRDGMIVSAQAGLLRGNFPRDVTVAGAARAYDPTGALADEPGTEWSTWREPCIASAASGGPGVRHLAVLISQGESRVKTIYSVAPMRDRQLGRRRALQHLAHPVRRQHRHAPASVAGGRGRGPVGCCDERLVLDGGRSRRCLPPAEPACDPARLRG